MTHGQPDAVGPDVRRRPARVDDAPAIARIYVDAWRATYPGLVPASVLVRMSGEAQAQAWTGQLAHAGTRDLVLVAEDGAGVIVGFGSCGPARDATLPFRGEIFTLYVDPAEQDRGIGRALLQGLFTGLGARTLDSALVWVLAANPSRFFYEAMGGVKIAERTERLWNHDLPQIAYGWKELPVSSQQPDSGGT